MIPPVTPPLLSAQPALPSGAANDPAKVAQSFEALFLSQLLEPIESGGSFFGDGPEGRTFAGLFREKIGEQLARQRPLGIADRIEAQLRAYTDSNSNSSTPAVGHLERPAS